MYILTSLHAFVVGINRKRIQTNLNRSEPGNPHRPEILLHPVSLLVDKVAEERIPLVGNDGHEFHDVLQIPASEG